MAADGPTKVDFHNDTRAPLLIIAVPTTPRRPR
jgi:hypothetical protein